MDFAYVLLFAQDNVAKEYSEKVAKLFSEVKNLDFNLQCDLHYVLKKLIKAHFRDNDKKAEELLTMITKAVHPDLLDKLPTFQKALSKIEEKDEIITKKEELIIEKDGIITEKEKENNRLKQILRNHNIKYD